MWPQGAMRGVPVGTNLYSTKLGWDGMGLGQCGTCAVHPGHVCVLDSGGWERQGGKAAWDIMGLAGSSSHVSVLT